MSTKSAGKETLILTLKLGVICIIVAGLLAFVNSITEPVIAVNDQKVFEASMAEVLPGSDDFAEVEIDYTPTETGVTFDSLYKSKGGYVASTVCSEGYGGDIAVMVGITNDYKIANIKIMSMSETAGLGAKAGNAEFTDQYKGLGFGIGVEKNNGGNAEDNTVSALSGATVTSKAVTKAVNCALEAAKAGGEANE